MDFACCTPRRSLAVSQAGLQDKAEGLGIVDNFCTRFFFGFLFAPCSYIRIYWAIEQLIYTLELTGKTLLWIQRATAVHSKVAEFRTGALQKNMYKCSFPKEATTRRVANEEPLLEAIMKELPGVGKRGWNFSGSVNNIFI